jgi:hypothetical protein
MNTEFSSAELEIFAVARTAAAGLRRTFDTWLDLGAAIQVARRHADVGGGSKKARPAGARLPSPAISC